MRIFLLGISTMVLCGAIWAFEREYPVALFARGTTEDRIIAVAFDGKSADGKSGFPVDLPLSLWGIKDSLVACDTMIWSDRLTLEPSAVQDSVRSGCAHLATAVLSRMPTLAMAALVRAESLAADAAADRSAMLVLAQKLAATEGWQGGRRLRTGLLGWDGLTTAAKSVLDVDLQTLLASPSGATTVAKLYLDYPEVQPRLQAMIETMSNQVQHGFIDAVRTETSLRTAAEGF